MNLCLKISDVFFQGQLFWPCRRNGWSDWCKTKRKYVGWMLGILCAFDLTQDLDLGFFKVKFLNSYISGIVWPDWCEMKRKRINKILGQPYVLVLWPHPWPWPSSFKVSEKKKVSRSVFQIALSQEWDSRLTWSERDVSHPFMTMLLSLVWPWWGGWMYWIVTGVTSDISMPSTYLVGNDLHLVKMENGSWLFSQPCWTTKPDITSTFLTHFGPVIPYCNRDLGPHWLG